MARSMADTGPMGGQAGSGRPVRLAKPTAQKAVHKDHGQPFLDDIMRLFFCTTAVSTFELYINGQLIELFC